MPDIIQEFARSGYRIIPLEGKIPDVPKGTDWRQIPKDPDACRADYLGNYGVVAEKRLIIDVDIKKGAPGKASFKKLTADAGLEKGWEKETFVVKTGTGGFHVYLDVPGEPSIGVLNKNYPGLEFRYGPFYVVGPGSVHPETQVPYTVAFGSPGALKPVPEAILALITKTTTVTLGAKPEPGFVDDDPINVERYKELLASMPVIPKGEGQTNSLYVVACRGRDLGLSRQMTRAVLAECYNSVKLVPPVEDAELDHVTQSAYTYAHEKAGHMNVKAIFKTAEMGEKIDVGDIKYDFHGKSNTPTKTLNNCVNYLITLPQIENAFRYNCFSGMIELDGSAPWYKERGSKGPNLTDEDTVLLKYFLTKTVRIEFSQQTVLEAIIVAGHKRHYHPIRNYLNSLVWDGKPRIDTWMIDYGKAVDTVYTRAIARKTLCAAVKRVMEPGCKWDHVLIIEGSQGIGKSTACRILGRNWAGDMNLDPHSKDAVAMMLNKWIIELSEMTALRWADANALKSFITREKDTVRLSYERHAKDFPRQSILIGTVNPEHVGYLKDITGNRRYWIVRFNGAVDLRGLEDSADQLWAEARAMYATEKLFLTGEAETLQGLEAQARMPEEPMRLHVNRWIKENPDVDEVTPDRIMEYMGIPMKAMTRADQSRVAQALTELGWEKKLTRENGVFTTSYTKPVRDVIAAMMEQA